MIVSNWDKWQTFRKDRGTPPWIKIYRNLLSNEEWVELSDSEKGQLISIWILAADKDGTIPDSAKMIQRMAMLDNKPNINKFIELGFLSTTCQPLDNHESASCPQLDAPEERREEKRRGEGGALARVPYQGILDVYHSILSNHPKVKVYSDGKKRKVKKLYYYDKKHQDLKWWEDYFNYIGQSIFLTGQVPNNDRKPFKADFEWVMNIENFAKISDGKYHDPENSYVDKYAGAI